MQPVQQIQPDGKQMVIIHFSYEESGREHIACMPGMREFGLTQFHPQYVRSNDYRAVTCPGCKTAKIFISMMK